MHGDAAGTTYSCGDSKPIYHPWEVRIREHVIAGEVSMSLDGVHNEGSKYILTRH